MYYHKRPDRRCNTRFSTPIVPWGARTDKVLSVTLAALTLTMFAPSGSLLGSTREAAASPIFTYVDNDLFSTSHSYNIYNSAFPLQAEYLVLLPLAVVTQQSMTSFVPEVAKSWAFHGNKLTVQLRSIRWQTGQPLTSTDVVDSEWLNGLSGNPIWQDITNVAAAGPSTVVFTLPSGVAVPVAETAIFQTFPVPSSEYGRFVTPGVISSVQSYYKLERTDPAAASKSTAAKTIATDYAQLEKFSPSAIVGDGPFTWKSWTTSEALLARSPTFFDASKVHVQRFLYDEVPSPANDAAVLDGTATIDVAGLSWTIYQQELRRNAQRIYAPSSLAQFELVFNNKSGPTSIRAVRQAIVYVINRPSATLHYVYGPHPLYVPATPPDGVWTAFENDYLTKAQIASLNPYSYSPARAAQVLQKAGFRKQRGQWYEPNGEALKLTITAPATFTNVILTYKLWAGWLTAFGIPTTEQTAPYASYTADQLAAQFQMSFYYGGGAYVDPLSFLSYELGPELNYPSNLAAGAVKGDSGLGVGPVANVPGLGSVDIPATIAHEANAVGPGPQMNRLVWIWARFVNQDMPYFSYIDKNYPLQVSEFHFTHWPPKQSYMWGVEALNQHAGLLLMMENGYIVPR